VNNFIDVPVTKAAANRRFAGRADDDQCGGSAPDLAMAEFFEGGCVDASALAEWCRQGWRVAGKFRNVPADGRHDRSLALHSY
jgi:hypothetical protein